MRHIEWEIGRVSIDKKSIDLLILFLSVLGGRRLFQQAAPLLDEQSFVQRLPIIAKVVYVIRGGC